MKTIVFARRNMRELLRDPLTLGFGAIFPCILLLLLSTIQKNVPVTLFALEELTPGIAVFGLSFLSLFAAQLVSKDRASGFLARLLTTSMRAEDFILGYTLPLIPMAVVQCGIVCGVSLALGLPFSIRVFELCIAIIPPAVFFIGLGLLLGCLLNEKQVGGICGALLTNLSAWLSDVWFELALLGDAFSKAAELLPFVHAVRWGRSVLSSVGTPAWQDLLWVAAYAAGTVVLSVLAFFLKMKDI